MCNKYIQTACAVSQRGAEVYSRIIPDLPAINSLGSLNLKYVQQSLIMSVLEVRNSFIKTRVTVNYSFSRNYFPKLHDVRQLNRRENRF